ncbi:hydroxyacylglutathione hydrolase C-terminal domain-containing protein, partial [Neisseria dumasiana]|uniref:hydroxyacylglutathione hydrolase C-terminal domain-containing protein n=1 Tax=Neisseria dumasiana TaxID=1931275 RepID=UPI003144EEA8
VSFVLGQLCVAHMQSFLQERPYATAYWPFSVVESCTSNLNPLALNEARHIPTLPVSLARERNINPFLRTGRTETAGRVRALSGINSQDEVAIFAAMRELKNRF